MAHKKGVGSTDNGRDSNSKRLGVKLFGGQHAIPGNIIVRQRGTKYHPGVNVGMGRDHTLHALIEGTVTYKKRRNNRTYVSIVPEGGVLTAVKKAAPKKAAKKAVPAPAAPAVEAAAPAPAPQADAKPDKLTKVEGIGPKVNGLLNAAGIMTFADLAGTSADRIKEILAEAGSRYQMMDPTTWAQQAQLAADGKWDELDVLQDELDGGRVVSNSSEEE